MLNIIIYITLCTSIMGGIIHEEHEPQIHNFEHNFDDVHGYEEHKYEPLDTETDIHHEIEHKHATSHQSFKMHHFHAVPVYIKKEDQEYIKNPIELGGTKHKLKILHPETEHHHGYGLVLENHSETEHHGHEHNNHEHEGYDHYHHE